MPGLGIPEGVAREAPPHDLAVGGDAVERIRRDEVVPRPAAHRVAGAVVLGGEPVLPRATVEEIASGAAVEDVIAGPAQQPVGAGEPEQGVPANGPREQVRAVGARDPRRSCARGEKERAAEEADLEPAAQTGRKRRCAEGSAPTTIPAVGSRLSQAISEGDGISILVEVYDAESAEAAEKRGADGLAVREGANAVRASSQLPLLHLGGTIAASGAAADGVVVPPDRAHWDEALALGLEAVVRVTRADDLARIVDELEPEIFLLSAGPESDREPLEELLALLHDVPAGKLAVAELRHATPEAVAELERAGVDAVLVSAADAEALIGASRSAA